MSAYRPLFSGVAIYHHYPLTFNGSKPLRQKGSRAPKCGHRPLMCEVRNRYCERGNSRNGCRPSYRQGERKRAGLSMAAQRAFHLDHRQQRRLLLGMLVLETWPGWRFWLVIDHHLHLYDADVVFPLAFRAKEGEVQQHGILINSDSRFAPANRTMHPFGSFIVHNNTPHIKCSASCVRLIN